LTARALPYHAVVWALAVAFCAPYLLPGSSLYTSSLYRVAPWAGEPAAGAVVASNDLMRDVVKLTLPARAYNGEMLRAGEIPFWNPHVFAGYPHLAMIQNNALYPLSAPLDALDPVASLPLSVLLHLGLAGSLMLAFLRRSGLGAAAALVGAVCFELNGLFLVRVTAPSYVFSGTWLPLLLLGTTALAERGTLRSGLPVALATCLTVLGGHPQIAVLALGGATAHLVWLLAWHDGTRRFRALGPFAVQVLLGLALAGFQLVPFAELLANSARTVVPFEGYLASALPVAGLLQALVPDVFGHPVDGTYWFDDLAHLLDGHAREERFWVFNYSGENVFTGAAPLVLAGFALARGARRRDVAFFALLALASLAVLLGTPLLSAAYLVVPGFAHSRPDRVLFLYFAAVSALAAHGAQAATAREPREPARGTTAAVAACAALLLAWVGAPLVLAAARRAALREWLALAVERATPHAATVLGQAAVALAVAGVTLALVRLTTRGRVAPRTATAGWVALVALPALAFGWKFNPAQPPPQLGTTALERRIVAERGDGRLARLLVSGRPALPANLAQLLAVDDVHGASAAGLERYLALAAAADPSAVGWMKYFPAFHDPRVAAGPLLDRLSAELVLADAELDAPYELLERSGRLRLYRNPRALPRFRLVASAEQATDDEDARRRVARAGFDAARAAVVTGAPAPALDASEEGPPGRVVVARRAPHRIELDVESGGRALLVSSEVFYPGWEARIDDRDADVLLVDAAFRGVAVPPGRHRVSFVYVPYAFRAGVALSVLAALALLWIGRPRSASHASLVPRA
jgi:hypothetical protein